MKKRNLLRGDSRNAKKEFESLKPPNSLTDSTAQQERSVLLEEMEYTLLEDRVNKKKNRRPKRWDDRISQMIDTIDELNDRLRDLGFQEEDNVLVDTDALREKYFSKADEEEEQKENQGNPEEEHQSNLEENKQDETQENKEEEDK